MKLLKIYLGEKDKYSGKPLFEFIVKRAYELGMKGVTVYRGVMGFGHKRHIHRSDFFSLSPDLPIIIEIVDSEEKIHVFIKEIENVEFDGLVFTADVDVIRMG
ncbi:DUF190 domain-containing protein [Thermotoga sp. KOL6]|uniref:DUF190 domain-containing protein n=1 Tax=Thermotoga sp. KOL6 TaxID=126741 RepID=UPI000C75A3CC|nr:DUF190 domain-containing protein [Thermotoga sp. KOL6]PLV58044.1 hypothetical protein AS005_08525 [Thermotoga sp. KOL6]